MDPIAKVIEFVRSQSWGERLGTAIKEPGFETLTMLEGIEVEDLDEFERVFASADLGGVPELAGCPSAVRGGRGRRG